MMKTEQKIAPAALRRGIAFLCTLVLTLLAVTLPAEAAVDVKDSFNVPNIRLSDNGYKNGTQPSDYTKINLEGRGSWTAADTTITGTVTPAEYSGKNWLGSTRYQCVTNASSTLTITNMSGEACLLTFSYTRTENGGTLTFGHNGETTGGDPSGGTYSARLAPTEAVTVTLTTTGSTDILKKSNQSQYIAEATLRDIELTSMNTNISVELVAAAEGGTYYAATADGKELSMGKPYDMPMNTVYTFNASPDPGYNFVGWYVDGHKLSPDSSFTTSFNESCTVEAKFVSKDAALFETGGQYFVDLNEAVAYAQANSKNKITLASDGKITGHYMIPAGITLLIPYNEAGTVSNGEPEFTTKYVTPSTFRELTMTGESTLTVNGELVVGGVLSAAGTSDGFSGTPSGQHGAIIMPEGSEIIVNGKLYAYGYISGPKDSTENYTSGFNCGTVTVNSGGEVYEAFQIKDFRGGNVTALKMLNNEKRVFLFSQYYIQNIEVPLTIHNGACDYAYSAVYALYQTHTTGAVCFIGSSGLFNITEGYITRTYVAKAPKGSTLQNDHVYYDVYGKVAMNSIKLRIAGYPISAKDYDLPINGNLSLRLFEHNGTGSEAVVNTPLALLPGFELYISKNSELTAAAPMYVYDAAEWYQRQYVFSSNYYKGNPVLTYTKASKGPIPKRAPSAQIDVNGTLTTSTGGVYTTDTGANIYSSEGTGKFIQSNAPDSTKKTYQFVQDGKTFYDIPITPAKLHNANGSYIETNKTVAKAGDTFTYCKGQECGGTWVKNLQVAAINNNDGTQVTTHETLQAAVEQFSQDSSGNTYIKMLHSTTEEINAQSDLYLDLNGCTVTGDFKMGNNTLYGMDSSAGTGYVTAPRGKIVGGVSYYAKTYETPPTVDGEYDRYVAILGQDQTLSFHHFNISVTGYRFELAAPQCALIFCGKFQGDDAAKDYLKSLGFTLTGDNSTESKNKMSDASNEEFVKKEGDAYLFELYLIRSFEKNSSDKTAYTEEFFATARATFKNGGTQDSGPKDSETKDSKTQHLSFQKAWQNALDPNSDMDKKDQEILRKFLKEFGINIQAE